MLPSVPFSHSESGTMITLTVSTGSVVTNEDGSAAKVEPAQAKQYEVPNLVGKTLEDAEIIIAENHLVRGSVVEVTYADAALSGLICKQSLEAGTKVADGTVIDLEFSTGTGENTVTSYRYVADIESPALEDENYAEGTSVYLQLVASDGTPVREWSIASFPDRVNVTGITQPTGWLTLTYTVTTPQTTVKDPDTGEETVVPSTTETREQRRAITFTPEN